MEDSLKGLSETKINGIMLLYIFSLLIEISVTLLHGLIMQMKIQSLNDRPVLIEASEYQ